VAVIKWNGAQLRARAAQSAALAVDRTMTEAVRSASREHSYTNQDGFLEASTDVIEAAHRDGDRIVGRWGSTADYALEVEIGTSRIGPNVSEREAQGGGNMWEIPGPLPVEGVTVEQPFTILPPGTMDGQETFVTLHKPSLGTGPFMPARPFLRPAADRENRLLATRMGAAFQGEPMP
jgi:hypothetical protein